MRKQMGIQAIKSKDEVKRSLEEKGRVLSDAKLDHVQRSLDGFRGHLELFANKHRRAIQEDAEFRRTFTLMCNQLGVDPLASNKGFWAELLGLGDYYFDLGVKIIAMAISTRDENGGILEISHICDRLNLQLERNARAAERAAAAHRQVATSATTKTKTKISEDDICRAVEKVSSLGTLRVGNIGPNRVLFSVPFEWSPDQTVVLEYACESGGGGGGVSVQMVSRKFGWLEPRSRRALMQLAADSLAWYDQPADEFWFPAFVGVKF